MSVEGTARPVAPLMRPVPLSDQAYEVLRRELLSGGPLAAGRLSEREVAKNLSMSRTPVREALRRLAMAGLVEGLPGGGYTRRRASLRDVQEHYELRLLLEPRAAAMAAIGRPEEAVAVLGDLERQYGQQANNLFHKALARLSGNRILEDVIDTLTDRLLSHRIYARPHGEEKGRLRRGHELIAEAVRARDPEAAAREMSAHLRLAREILRDDMRRGEEEDRN